MKRNLKSTSSKTTFLLCTVALTFLTGLFSSAEAAWPWPQPKGQASVYLAFQYQAATQRYSDGRILQSRSGEHVPIFSETPGTLRTSSTYLHTSLGLLPSLSAALSTQIAHVVFDWDLPNDAQTGFGDTTVLLNWALRNEVTLPIMVSLSIRIPTGSDEESVFVPSLGEGFIVYALQLTSGWKMPLGTTLVASQQIALPASKDVRGGHVTRGSGGVGELSLYGGWQRIKGMAGLSWDINEVRTVELFGSSEIPGNQLLQARLQLGSTFYNIDTMLGITIPILGVNYPTAVGFYATLATQLTLF